MEVKKRTKIVTTLRLDTVQYVDIVILIKISSHEYVGRVGADLHIQRVHISSSFYRATLCVNAVFAVARCLSVCLTFCPSVTLVDCIHMAEDIVKFLYRPGSPIIIVFF